ncbi:ABC transporter ATP-binding protein, partial [Acidithiobacillus ferrivorans]|nr:ABC transporter ATP-binding protein [Acidithiobacillus ferrivorans]
HRPRTTRLADQIIHLERGQIVAGEQGHGTT